MYMCIYIYILLLLFWPSHAAYGILVPQPGIEPGPSAVRAWSPNHWNSQQSVNIKLYASVMQNQPR